MLNIFVDCGMRMLPDNFITRISDCFDAEYDAEWFSDIFVQEIIRGIDNSEVQQNMNGNSVNIYNEYLGNIPPQNLSNGAKSLILLWKTNYKLNGDRMGDNCIPILLKIASFKDVVISLGHIPKFPEKFDAILINDNRNIEIHDYENFLKYYGELLVKGKMEYRSGECLNQWD